MSLEFSVIGTNLEADFNVFLKYSPQIALEVMSKAGNAVREAQRTALKATPIYTKSAVTKGVKHLVSISTPLPFGHREQDNSTANPDNMASMINSYLMEASMTLVVNGSHGDFYPIIRRDGEVVGVGGRVKAVGKKTHAILQRMNDDTILPDYPKEGRLSKKNIGTHYATLANSMVNGKVNGYLKDLYIATMDKVLLRHRTQINKRLV